MQIIEVLDGEMSRRELEQHCIVYAEDPDDLDFWLYKQRRIWSDMKQRQQKASARDFLRRIRRL
jgi:hypothetical protein